MFVSTPKGENVVSAVQTSGDGGYPEMLTNLSHPPVSEDRNTSLRFREVTKIASLYPPIAVFGRSP